MGAFTWSLRVTSPDHRAARVASRKRQFAVSRPLDFDVQHEGITALEYALGALGAEFVTGLREIARRRRFDLEDLEAVVTGELNNPLTYLEVQGEVGHPGISAIYVKLYLASGEVEVAVRRFVDDAIELLPLARTFRSLLDLDLQVTRTA